MSHKHFRIIRPSTKESKPIHNLPQQITPHLFFLSAVPREPHPPPLLLCASALLPKGRACFAETAAPRLATPPSWERRRPRRHSMLRIAFSLSFLFPHICAHLCNLRILLSAPPRLRVNIFPCLYCTFLSRQLSLLTLSSVLLNCAPLTPLGDRSLPRAISESKL